MSLLNQVLQDLEDRSPVEQKRPLRLAVTSQAGDSARAAPGEKGPSRRLVLSGIAVILIFIAAVWVFYPAADPVDAESAAIEPALAIPAEQIAQSMAAPQPSPSGSEPGTASKGRQGVRIEPSTAAGLPEESTVANAPDEVAGAAAGPKLHGQAPSTPSLDLVKPSPGPGNPADAASPSANESVDYLVLRNTQLPPATAHPEKGNTGIVARAPSVKTAKPVQQRPLDEVRQEIELGELSYAEYLLHERLRTTPEDGEARELLVGLMLRGERHDAVMVQLERGLKHEPDNAKFSLIMARLLAQSGDVQGALQALEGTSGAGPGEVQRLQMLGALYQQLARYEQAEASYRALLELTPAAAAAWAGLGLSLDGLGEPAAYEAYLQALKMDDLPPAADAYVRQRVAELGAARD